MNSISPDILAYNDSKGAVDEAICSLLAREISHCLDEAENKIWHGHPVWFLKGNPIVGYSRQRTGIRLMFWSGQDFEEPDLQPARGKFKDASIFYQEVSEINLTNLERWLQKSKEIQWDYKNLMKRKGVLERLK